MNATIPNDKTVCPKCQSRKLERKRTTWDFRYLCLNCAHIWWVAIRP